MDTEVDVRDSSLILLKQGAEAIDRILDAYSKSSKQWPSTLYKLAQVRQRGRKRTMVG